MKTYSISLLCLLFSIHLFAQQTFLSPPSDTKFGVFGGPIFEIGLDPNDGVSAGGMGGISFGHYFIGGFGQGSYYGQTRFKTTSFHRSLGIGGVMAGFVYPLDPQVHFYSNFKVGWGAATLSDDLNRELDIEDNIFALNPEIGLELSVTSWARFAITGSYRWVSGVDNLEGFDDGDFENYSVGLVLRFGYFSE